MQRRHEATHQQRVAAGQKAATATKAATAETAVTTTEIASA